MPDEGTRVIDLSSALYGVDLDAARRMGVRAWRAPGLPGSKVRSAREMHGAGCKAALADVRVREMGLPLIDCGVQTVAACAGTFCRRSGLDAWRRQNRAGNALDDAVHFLWSCLRLKLVESFVGGDLGD